MLILGGCVRPSSGSKTPTQAELVERIIARMPAEEKVGQLIVGGLHGLMPDEATDDFIAKRHFGGFILFDRNLRAPEQVRALTSGLMRRNEEAQAELDPHHPGVPLFICVDEEGGKVARFRDHIAAPPSEEALGKGEETAAARVWAVKTAKALRSYGINLNFAPVLDLGLPPERSYSTDPARVTMFGNAAAAGYTQEKFSFVIKHFPGIGKGREDTHLGNVVVDTTLAQLESEDMIPFRNVLFGRVGGNCAVMVGHVVYPAVDAKHPASLSHAVITGLLRQKLSYDGVVFTDDLEMGAISKQYDFGEAAVMAVEAGADVILVCHEYEHMREAYDGLLEAVNSGRIPQERLDASVRRIIRMKLASGK